MNQRGNQFGKVMKEIYLKRKEEKFTVLVDDDAYELLNRHTWYIMYSGKYNRPYAFTEFNSKGVKRMMYMHQLVSGSFSMADHKNGNTLDNQFHNLRPADHQRNGWNKGKNRRNSAGENTSQYKGVTKYVNSEGQTLYRVQIKLTKKGFKPEKWYRKSGFTSEIEAARDYNREVVIHRGDWAWVNPIPGEAA